MSPPRIALITVGLIVAVAAGLWLWPSLPALQNDLTELHLLLEHGQGWRDRNRAFAALLFVGGFAVLGALPVPVVVVMTIAGGAFFGFWLGLILSMAGTMAAAGLTFLAARHVLVSPVRRLMGSRVDQLDRTVREDGALALLSLRLTPAVPFFVLNLAAGVSVLTARVFFGITALGVLPNKAILSAAGTQLAEIDQVTDIIGPRIIAIIVVLALFPWIARWLMRRLRRRTPARS